MTIDWLTLIVLLMLGFFYVYCAVSVLDILRDLRDILRSKKRSKKDEKEVNKDA